MRIGFTGTRKGMTDAQFETFEKLLSKFLNDGPSVFHHGQCVGADCEAAAIAHDLGYYVIAHPGYYDKNPSWMGSRGAFDQNDEVLSEKPFLVRDHDIVDASEILIGTPGQVTEQRRSGTWATIRYGKKTEFVIIIYPDGSVIVEEGPRCS
jgi:hypothetical protein